MSPPRELAVIEAGLDAYLPPEKTGTADWAASSRWLNNEGGGFVGRWLHSEAPYLVGPMDALDSQAYLEVAIVGPGRSGKTSVAENWLGRSIVADQAPTLWYEPTEAVLKAYVKSTIEPLIDLHRDIKGRQGLRPVDDSVGFKRFRGMTVEFLTATYSNFINKTAARLILDEIDAYPASLGDVFNLADIRRQTFGQSSKILAVSHPDRALGLADRRWTEGIMKLYRGSDRQIWYWPCPHCNGWSSPNPTGSRVMTFEYDEGATLEEIEESAGLLCPLCGVVIEDRYRRPMNQAGVYIGRGQEIDQDGTVTGVLRRSRTAGFWIVGAMSNFVIGGWGGLARALEDARRNAEAGTDDGLQSLKDAVVKRIGIPYDPPREIGTVDAQVIADRARDDLPLGYVPEGVRFITTFTDIQGNRFEHAARGWGVGSESWLIDAIKIPADPGTSGEDWDALFERLLGLEYPLADSSGRVMRPRASGFDTQGQPGVTAQAYAVWRRYQQVKRRVRLLGRFDGRESWTIMPTQGQATPNAPRLQVVRPDSERKDRMAKAGGAVPVARFNANTFKDALAGHLARAMPGPGHVHFPAALRSDLPDGWFEQLVAETRNKRGVWEKVSQRNEALDLMVGCHVIAHLNGLARINWAQPPSWAGSWDTNRYVGLPTAPVASGEKPGAARAIVRPPIVADDRAKAVASRLA